MLHYPGLCRLGTASIKQIPFHICKKLTIIYIIKGRLEFSTVAGSQTLYEGQIEILNVKEPVMLKAEGAACKVLYFYFDVALLQRTGMDFECVTYNCNICNFFSATAQKPHIDILTSRLLLFAIDAASGMPLSEAEKKAADLLKYIMEWFDDVGHVFSENPGEDVSKERFQRISSYMIANVTKKISLQDIAQNEYLSTPYLSKEFAAKLEKNYHTIINYYRTINVAIQLLDTDHTLTYIAETSGFSSVRYYHKVFSSFLGCLPSKFRSLYKGKPQNAAEETLNADKLQEIALSAALQNAQTNIKVCLASPPDELAGEAAREQSGCRSHIQRIRHFTYSGEAAGTRTYTFVLEGAPNAEKSAVLYIDDDLSRSVEQMAADTSLRQCPYMSKLQGPRREVRHLSKFETDIHASVSGAWIIELYVIV